MSTPSKFGLLWFRLLLLSATVAFLALHFVHLSADFPNFSPWMDWSKYTDEGWYGDAAVRHFQRGQWYVAGDFNPAAALPVWPFLEALLFRFSGVSVVAARGLAVAVFGAALGAAYALLRRWSPNPATSLVPEAGVLLLATSPFCFVFTRLAILEPLLVLWTLLALLVAGSVRRPLDAGPQTTQDTGAAGWQSMRRDVRANLWQVLALGLLLPLLILTKTTGVFLLPCIAFLLLAALDYRVRPFLHLGVPAATLGGGLWLAYFGLLVRPHYLLDYQYLFAANAYTRITLDTAAVVLHSTYQDGEWMGRALYLCGVGCLAAAALSIRRLRPHPLIGTLLLWALGYDAFLAYHNNLQPRYYLVVTVPLALLVPATVEQVLLPWFHGADWFRGAGWRRGVTLAASAGIAAIVVVQARQMLSYVRHPQYTLVHAAHAVHDVIAAHEAEDPTHNPLVLSISGSDLSLMTGLPSICDDFGTLELVDRVRKYRPGWYVAWNAIEDDKMDALTPFYHIERVAAFPAMDDPNRNLLIVYRLDDALHTPTGSHRRTPPPKGLKTKVGQQPSTNQLEH